MVWTVTPIMLVMFASALIAVVVGIVALRRYPDRVAGALAVMMFGVANWAIPQAISLGYADLETVLFWQRLMYPGVLIGPTAYLVVALAYAGYDRWLSRRVYAALLVIPAITVPIVWMAPGSGLFWRSPELVDTAGLSILVYDRGLWNWIHLGYGYLVTAGGLVLFASVVVRSGPIYRKQAGLMFLGGVVPLATNVVTLVAVPEPTIDLTTPALAVTGVTFALALFYLDLLEVRPVARNRLVEELDDGVVVIGPEDRVRDFNPTAKRLFEGIAIDEPASEVLPEGAVPDGGELEVEIEGRKRLFRTRSTVLSDNHSRETGRLIYFNDVTEIIEREQRISVLNRVLRHNIRNELNVAAGHLETLSGRVSGADREHVETAVESVHRVTTLAEKARGLEHTLREGESDRIVPATDVVERVVSDARERFDDATIEYDPPAERARVRVIEESLLEMALSELVENGVLHNDRDSPRVTVDVDPGPEAVQIRIADDGPGIPEAEYGVLRTRREADLEHGSGLGLWIVKWTASLSGGNLSFAENDPRGSVVTVSLPTP